MKKDIILAGVGGQGLLALAGVLGEAARSQKLQLKQAEVHGMAQRGGVVQSHVRLSDETIHSDLVWEGTADLILALEPMEALRYVPFLDAEGMVVSNDAPFANIPDYPDTDSILTEIRELPQYRLIDAAGLAKEAGALQAANMVMLGAGAPYIGLDPEVLIDSVRVFFASKGDAIIETNVKAFRLGMAASRAG